MDSSKRININELTAYIRRAMGDVLDQKVFEINDSLTRELVSQKLSETLESMLASRAVEDYAVVCDTTNNDNATIENNQLCIDVWIKPTSALETMFIRAKTNVNAECPDTVYSTHVESYDRAMEMFKS